MSSSTSIPRRRPRSDDDDDGDSDDTSSVSTRNPTPASHASSNKRIRLKAAQDNNDEDDDTGDSTSQEDSDGDAPAENSLNPASRDKGRNTADTGAQENDDEDDEDADEDGSQENSGDESSAERSSSGLQKTQDAGSAGTQNQAGDGDGNGAKDAYKPGAIVRIKVTDFVTYTSAEFFPGPKLNMVIGPNGTGKSTLVCAICLGLGWGPQHLGRAKDPGEFVKHGCREATIEIELAGGPKHRRNPVVSRTIKREGNKSTFMLNGKQASRSQVLKLAQSFAIQIDNLCQFLPQDKVSEFAALTPIELLYSTQRAAAGPEMIEWHDNLKTLRTEQKKLQSNNQGDRDLLANLENRQEMQRADVERMRERAQIKRKIEMLEYIRPVTKYKQTHADFKELKRKKDNVSRELDILKSELEPALRAVNAKQSYCVQLDGYIDYKKRGVETAEKNASDIGKTIEQHDDSMKDLNNQISGEKKQGTQYKQEATKIQQTINKLTRQLNDESVNFDIDWYNEQIAAKRRQARDLEEKAQEIKERRRPLFDTFNVKKEDLKSTEQQLQGLDSQAGRQEAKLKQVSPDSFKAYKWLQENQDKFEHKVFGPPIVECSIKDPKYADAVESLLQKTDFTAFTTQSRNDFRTLQRSLNMEMRLHDISIKTSSVPLENFQPPVSGEEIQKMGFDGWAKDFLNGPDPILSVLCSENRLHQTPVTLRDISDEEFSRMENGSISSWVAGKQSYQVSRRREYGPSATSTRVRQVRPARVWTSQPVDTMAKQDLIQAVSALKEELRDLQQRMETEKANLTEMGQSHGKCEEERRELEREKAEKQTALTQQRAIPEKIRQQETKRRNNEKYCANVKTRVLELRHQQDELSVQKAEATLKYSEAVIELREAHEELIKLGVRRAEAVSDLEILKARNKDHSDKLAVKTNELKEAVNEVKTKSEEVRKLHKEAGKVVETSATQPDLAALMTTLIEHSVDQLEADIDSEKARLELTQGGSSNIIKEFEERERQIQKIRSKLEEFQTQLADYEHAINEIRGKWEPQLDALVKSISDAFSDSFARIGCAGQVSLDKAEDEAGPDNTSGGSNFDQWSIQIHVKFRENENLSLLDSHRQSGGERAVSTIFYLMALQSLSASPFRVVDEINQGMDPRNERMVHGRLVDIACANGGYNEDGTESSGGSQYFLITPKLLSGLVYKPGMRVLCIYSGEHMPAEHGVLDVGEAVQRMRAIRESDQGKGKGRAFDGAISQGDSRVDVYA
ncbi:P-loop containing nucleoside triphosphate hydrolase protein [Aspergillus steynii IBT 23096]|uniref:Structural maintenance of chromosomes protein 5 n=1 Tax=Aspergillus steynii IBT 23096 TaxID=1392250 RepID=A0A2I2G8P4_9EURO|nr:P-loop containing nucleoside triphosphate hydrolase protein [Aspergillus steynii IBT 23096]PLB49249.1 P-loop containing nucleoside triphosphate hydrolase protein [Aspergillus steynii IBT 23096]